MLLATKLIPIFTSFVLFLVSGFPSNCRSLLYSWRCWLANSTTDKLLVFTRTNLGLAEWITRYCASYQEDNTDQWNNLNWKKILIKWFCSNVAVRNFYNSLHKKSFNDLNLNLQQIPLRQQDSQVTKFLGCRLKVIFSRLPSFVFGSNTRPAFSLIFNLTWRQALR